MHTYITKCCHFARFVAADLASVDRTRQQWVVVGMHRMMVSPATWRRRYVGDLDNMDRLQADYEDLFKQYGVSLHMQTCCMDATCTVYDMGTWHIGQEEPSSAWRLVQGVYWWLSGAQPTSWIRLKLRLA